MKRIKETFAAFCERIRSLKREQKKVLGATLFLIAVNIVIIALSIYLFTRLMKSF